MIAIALGQMLMSFNVAALPVSLSGMVASFGVPPTTIATGIVMYSLSVAGFVMLGAKLVQRFGSTQVFRVVIGLVRDRAGADGDSAGSDRDALGTVAGGACGGGDRARAGGADRPSLSRGAAGDGGRRARFGARRRRASPPS